MLNDLTGHSGTIERSRLSKKLCYIALITALVLCGIVFTADVIFQWSGLQIFSLALFPAFFAILFAIAAIVRTTFYLRMLQEEEEKRLLERRKESVGSIMDVSEDVRFSASRTLKNFEKYLPSVLAVLCFVLGGLILYFLMRTPEAAENGEATADLLKLHVPANPINLAFLSIVCAVFAFFSGIFLSGLSGTREFRWLKPVANMFVFAGLILFLTALSALLYIYGKTTLETYLTKAIFYIECILTIEFLANFIMDFYRPRNQEEQHPVYESRLLTLFTEPGGVVRNLAASLDYQFGFKVSKTSVYKFVSRVFIPAMLVWAFLLWAFTVIGEVGPGELGIRERLGKAEQAVLEPGVHFKLPWPFGRIIRIPVDQPQCVTVGITQKTDQKRKDVQVVLWNKNHYVTDDPFLVANKEIILPEIPQPFAKIIPQLEIPWYFVKYSAGDQKQDAALHPFGIWDAEVFFTAKHFPKTFKKPSISESTSILETTLPIYYRAKRSEIHNYAYNFNSIPDTVLAIGKAEATAYFASIDFDFSISEGRDKVCSDLKKRIQEQCDGMQMGIEVVSVNMMDAHPPIGKDENTNVAEAYQNVVIEMEGAKVKKSQMESEAAKITTIKETEQQKIKTDAQLQKDLKVALANAEEKLYDAQMKAYATAPEIFKLMLYLDFIVNDCKDKRKFIVSKSLLSRIYEFNFEEKAKFNLLEEEDAAINQ